MSEKLHENSEAERTVDDALKVGKEVTYLTALMQRSGEGKHTAAAGLNAEYDPSNGKGKVTLDGRFKNKGIEYEDYERRNPDGSIGHSSETIKSDGTIKDVEHGMVGRFSEGAENSAVQFGSTADTENGLAIADQSTEKLQSALDQARSAAIEANRQQEAA